MSRTCKGSKGPGWEPWSNKHDKAVARADYREPDLSPGDEARLDEICEGCPLCCCVKCGGFVAVIQDVLSCVSCGDEPC